MINNTNEEHSFEILPDEIVLEITSFLPSIDLIFSLSNVCKSWRRLVLPIIKQHYQEFALPNNSTSKPMSKYHKSVEEFHSDDENDNFLFQADFRKFIKTMLRKYIYQVAERWINAKLELEMSNGIIDLSNCNGDSDQKVVKQLMSELDLITEYFSHFSDFKEEDISEQKTPNKKEEKETSSGNSVFKGIVDFLSSFFSQPTQSPSTTKISNTSTFKILNRNKPTQLGKASHFFKCSVFGDSGVGKSSLINCIIYNSTFGKYVEIPTIGTEFFTKKYQFSQDKTYSLQIWDLYGNERYHSLSLMRYRNLHVVFLMFDLTADNSLKHVPMWYEDLKKWDGHLAEIILIGNKTDLVNRRCIKKEQAQQMAFETLDGSLYVETTNSDIKHAHTVALYSMIVRYCILRNIEGGNKV